MVLLKQAHVEYDIMYSPAVESRGQAEHGQVRSPELWMDVTLIRHHTGFGFDIGRLRILDVEPTERITTISLI